MKVLLEGQQNVTHITTPTSCHHDDQNMVLVKERSRRGEREMEREGKKWGTEQDRAGMEDVRGNDGKGKGSEWGGGERNRNGRREERAEREVVTISDFDNSLIFLWQFLPI